MNPLIPTAGDLLLASLVSVHVVLALIALVLLLVSRVRRANFLLQLLAILFVPVIGPAAWLFARYRSRRTHEAEKSLYLH